MEMGMQALEMGMLEIEKLLSIGGLVWAISISLIMGAILLWDYTHGIVYGDEEESD